MIDIYCYYRVPVANAASLQTLVRALHASLAARFGIAAQLKRRPGASDAQQTWMEVYPAVPDDFADVLERATGQAGQDGGFDPGFAAEFSTLFASLAASARHIEIFTDVAPCA